jgi:hypothetical protein
MNREPEQHGADVVVEHDGASLFVSPRADLRLDHQTFTLSGNRQPRSTSSDPPGWRRDERQVTLTLDLHDSYNRGGDINRALRAIIDRAVAKKAPLVEITPAWAPASRSSGCCAS